MIHGLRQDNMTPAHLARAAMEGATLGLAYGMKRFRDLGMDPSEIRITGGGSKSPTWRQVAADAFNAEVVSLDTAEGAGLGSAIQAAHAYLAQEGSGRSYTDLCAELVALDESTRVGPSENAAGYAEQLERQMGMTNCLHKGGYL